MSTVAVRKCVCVQVPREVRRTKQVLLEIEAMYVTLLRLEELNDPLAIANALILKVQHDTCYI